MNLSKIYRGTDTAGLERFCFRSFNEDEALPGAPAAGAAAGAAPAGTHGSTVAVPPAGASQQALQDAYARGQRDALESAGAGLEQTAQHLARVLAEVDQLRSTLIRRSREDMLRLVMAIAEQVIHQEISVQPAIVTRIIEQALQASVRADHYRIHINPADLAAVNEQKPLFLASISGLKNLIIEADQNITRGGCRVESDLGEVDATIESQLATIRQALRDPAAGSS
ncbi:MAG: FliH/SctL family protein [Pelovirga sp.]